MSIADEITRSRTLVARHWQLVADRCPDARLAGSIIEPVEGLQGARALDLDRRYHVDAHARTRRGLVNLSTRFQAAEFAERRTITLRQTEVVHLRQMAADDQRNGPHLHVQMYGDDHALRYVIIAEVEPLIRRFSITADNAMYWYHAYDGTAFVALGRTGLQECGAYVWHNEPVDRNGQGAML